MADLASKVGDTARTPRYQLLDVDGTAADLSGATVVQRFDGAPAAGSPCTIDGSATDGIVYLTSRQHLPVPAAGRQSVVIAFETEVTYTDGTIQTFPTEGYDRWKIWDDLDV